MNFLIKRFRKKKGVKDMKEVMLFTPGLDSFLANFILKNDNRNFDRVYFDLGCKYSDLEIMFLERIYEKGYVRIDGRVFLGDMELDNYYVPNRNLILCTLAQSVFNADVIYLNGVKCDRVSDNNLMFRKQTSRLLSRVSEKPIIVKSALSSKEKYTWCEFYTNKVKNDFNKRMELVINTFSCFSDNRMDIFNTVDVFEYSQESDEYILKDEVRYPGCLNCDACFRKVCALTGANLYIDIKDPDRFRKKFIPLITSNKYFKKRYPARTKSIKQYLAFLETP